MAGALTEGIDARVVVARGGLSLDVELGVAPGETAVLLGPNGAGKSTVLGALAGLVPLAAGRIRINGRVVDDPDLMVFVPPEGRRAGVVLQDLALFPHLTVEANVAFGLRAGGNSREQSLREARAWLGRLGIGELARARAGHLSGGEAQRAALARALAPRPDLLLLDEPMAALDAAARVETRRLLQEVLVEFPGPRLLITHDPGEAFLLADHIVVLEGGRVTQEGDADRLRLGPRTRYVADLAGVNLFVGQARGGRVFVDGHLLHTADRPPDGSVLVTLHPRAVSLHRGRPEGSPRNGWPTRVALVEHLGERVRLQVGPPLPLTVEITPDSLVALGIGPGSEIWVSIKATEVGVEPA